MVNLEITYCFGINEPVTDTNKILIPEYTWDHYLSWNTSDTG